MSKPVRWSLGPLLLLALAAGPLPAQTGEEILKQAVEAYETRVQDIEDYTVTQRVDVMGRTVTNHFVKRMRDGHPVFVQASRQDEGESPRGWGNPYQLFLEMAGRAELAGRDTVDGREVWTLSVTDFSGVDVARMTPRGARGEFRPERATFAIDVRNHVVRRLSVDGKMVADGQESPIHMTARFRDYRDRSGMLYPFRTEVSVQGMDAVMSPEERERARRQLRLLRARLDSMSASRREMIESRIGPKIEQLEKAVESGRLDVTIDVRELKVNQQGEKGAGDGGGGGG